MAVAKPLGPWVAVEPDFQGEGEVQDSSGLWLPALHKARFDAIYAVVLAKGKDAPAELSVGDRVVFQRFSGHPAQADALPAEVFGGTPGRYAALVRVVDGRPGDDLEDRLRVYQNHVKNLMQLLDVVRPTDRPRCAILLAHYRAEVKATKAALNGCLRSRRHHPVDAPWAVGRGLEAVVES
jgi:hypothetical protein